MSRLSEMTEEELRLLSVKKKKNGCYTHRALAAQGELWSRSHYPIDNNLEEICGGYYDDGYGTIDVLSSQY